MTVYVYIRSEPGLWTVGHYRPDGAWVAESDHDSDTAAAERVRLLNGGPAHPDPALLGELEQTADWLGERAAVVENLGAGGRTGEKLNPAAVTEAARLRGRASLLRQVARQARGNRP
jgi:hypothetical protein